jgi:putative aminopeptidase FrvX
VSGRPRIDWGWLAAVCRLPGVSGDEEAVRAAVWERVRPHVDEAWVDARGGLCARRAWERGGPRVALAASLDEPGLIVAGIEPDGLLRFGLVGDPDPAALPGARVTVGPRRLPAAVVGPPPHVGGRRDAALLRLDIGARNRTEAAAEVRPGDRAAFLVPAGPLGALFRAKALHGRAGLAAAAAVLEAAPADRPLALCCTAEDRVGAADTAVAAREAGASAWLGVTAVEAGDAPRAALGAGPALAVPPPGGPGRALLAGARRLPFQPGGPRPRPGARPPGAWVAVPARHLRAPAGLLHPADLQAAAELLGAALEGLWASG